MRSVCHGSASVVSGRPSRIFARHRIPVTSYHRRKMPRSVLLSWSARCDLGAFRARLGMGPKDPVSAWKDLTMRPLYGYAGPASYD